MKKTLAIVLTLCMLLTSCAALAETTAAEAPATYTYHTYSTALGNNWNPHTWETNADQSILESYLSIGFCDMSIKDSENGIYQWVYEMATSIEDVTAEHRDDLTKYSVALREGDTADTAEKGYVYEIKLNPNAKWENGEAITADDYIYSMQQLLNPKMKNYRANLYYAGESAVAGGNAYYNAGSPIYDVMVPAYGDGETPDYSYDLDKGIADGMVYVNVSSDGMTLYSMSLADLNTQHYGGGLSDEISQLASAKNAYGYTKVTAENREVVENVVKTILSGLFNITDETEQNNLLKEALFVDTGKVGDMCDYDATVGCYKVDDYTIRYVTAQYIDLNNFLISCTNTWLVYKPYYEAGMDTTGTLTTTNYGTAIENTMSYGPYKLVSLQADKQMVFVQNENWYGYEKQEDGSLLSMTNFEVDGESVPQYAATSIVVDVMDDSSAKQAFLKGELAEWSPSPEEVFAFATSDRLYKVDDTFTMSFFFNCGLKSLQTMDASKGNTNSVVLSSTSFRKAMSLAIDRAEYVTATQGYKPAYSLMNNLYHYDIFNDPTSSYRGSDEAMQAICNLYGVKYGEGTPYATLKDAYQSITGYNLTEAKELFAAACKELVEAGLYKEGEPIVIRIGWAAGALQSADNKQCEILTKQLNAALEGSGFGTLTLEAVGNINNRYADVANGEYAIGYGAWGGAALYPFRNFQCYCDTDQYDVNEIGCWDPATEMLTLNVNGEDVTMSWKDWSGALIGTGRFTDADFATKLYITAQMEELYLQKYYRIPLAGKTSVSLLSYQVDYYTEDYNLMYGFGGLRLMTFNYNDAEWAEYVAEEGGTLSYE